jgi:guanosine-3',5'-bis(diphosphate) 3'-pyrophosphohydrolase
LALIRFDDILEKAAYVGEKGIPALQKAYVFAGRAHKGQVRRSGEPYLSHPLEVTAFLADMGLDKTTLVAGLLHDALEDTDVSAVELRDNFGKDVAALVEGVTKISRVQDSSPETKRAETIRKIILAMTDDIRVIFIKLADRIHNLKTLDYLDEGKRRRIAQETMDIYAPIANRLGMGRMRAELEDLSFRYVAPEEYTKVSALVEPRAKASEKDLRRMEGQLDALMAEHRIPAQVFSRIKRLYSVWSKMKRRRIGFDQVYDFLALRLITDSVKNCYAALGVIHQRWPHLPQRFRDFIAMPKPTLYQALHTTVITEGQKTYEIQIRTREMHEVAENGIAAHWRYKEGASQDRLLEDERLRWLRETAALYKEQKSSQEFLRSLKMNLIPEEVYVFTPKGKVINLPPGATALDFAFKIHTEIGLHATGAKVNGTAVPLKTPVRTGDIIEIETSREKKPTRSMLSAVTTSGARQPIKRWLKSRARGTVEALGRKLWERQVRKTAVPSNLQREGTLLARLSDVLGVRLRGLPEFYRMVGSGKVVVDPDFLAKVFPSAGSGPRRETFLEKVASRVSRKDRTALLVKAVDDQAIKLAKCCSPIRGEPIVGYITAGKGITVHSLRCPRVAKEMLDAGRLVDISWDKGWGETFRAGLMIHSKDSPGMLAAITAAIADLKGNISKAEVTTSVEGSAGIRLELHIKDLSHLEEIIRRISSLRDVSAVDRT